MEALATEAAGLALEPLFGAHPAAGPVRGGRLPEPLRKRYGGDLAIPLRLDRPTVISNFVSTLDGVVSYNTPEASGGGEISGFFEPDRFVMGLLRALADVVLIGAGTLRAAPGGSWTASFIHPASEAAFASLRSHLGLPANPLTAVVTASGDIDFEHAGLADPHVPALLVTTEGGAAKLAGKTTPRHVDIKAAGRDRVDARSLLDVLARQGAELVLCEGGPQLLGQLLASGLVDELFLTLAPQIAGRSPNTPRLSLVEGTAFAVTDAPWARLLDLRRCDNHLFARYDL